MATDSSSLWRHPDFLKLGIVTLALSDLIVPVMAGAPLLIAGLLGAAAWLWTSPVRQVRNLSAPLA